MITDSFIGDLKYFETLLSNFTPFSLARFGDGEYQIINNRKIDLLYKKEFAYNGEAHLRSALTRSFQFDTENYYVGIACACCAGNKLFSEMEEKSRLPKNRLTWANVFVNANYKSFKNSFPRLFSKYKTTLVSPGHPENLPMKIDEFKKIGANAWITDKELEFKLKNNIRENKTEGELFLFCAGPYANILCYNLYKEFPKNTYIDLGSVFNIELGIGANRKYLKGKNNINKVCTWGKVFDKKRKTLSRFLKFWRTI